MEPDLRILFDFLDKYAPEVSGRASTPLPEEVSKRLERFSEGKCEQTEIKDVCALLQKNPSWISHVARLVNARAQQAGA